MTLNRIRRDLYLTQRGIGDLQALRRGPDVLTRRLARRYVTRTVFNAFGNGRRTHRRANP